LSCNRTYLAIDELKVAWALSITVTSTVFCARLVGRVLGHATVGIHGDEVYSAVQSTRKLAEIDIKGKLRVGELEHLILGIRLHQVETGSNVCGVLALGNELEGEGVSAGLDTISARVVGTVKSALGCASCVVGASGGIPFVPIIAVSSTAGLVKPSPVGIENHLSADGRA
jgi:hypothetical protein